MNFLRHQVPPGGLEQVRRWWHCHQLPSNDSNSCKSVKTSAGDRPTCRNWIKSPRWDGSSGRSVRYFLGGKFEWNDGARRVGQWRHERRLVMLGQQRKVFEVQTTERIVLCGRAMRKRRIGSGRSSGRPRTTGRSAAHLADHTRTISGPPVDGIVGGRRIFDPSGQR